MKPSSANWIPQPDPVGDCYIVDIDGTMALLNGRNPYDTSTCEQDLPNTAVVRIVKALQKDARIIFVSGRHADHVKETTQWLDVQGFALGTYAIYLRKSGDNRRDAVIKKEILDTIIAQGWNVLAVIDDRAQCVTMWRANELTCLQVAPGNF